MDVAIEFADEVRAIAFEKSTPVHADLTRGCWNQGQREKGLRGRFGMCVPALMEALGMAEVEDNPRNHRMRHRGRRLRRCAAQEELFTPLSGAVSAGVRRVYERQTAIVRHE